MTDSDNSHHTFFEIETCWFLRCFSLPDTRFLKLISVNRSGRGSDNRQHGRRSESAKADCCSKSVMLRPETSGAPAQCTVHSQRQQCAHLHHDRATRDITSTIVIQQLTFRLRRPARAAAEIYTEKQSDMYAGFNCIRVRA